MTASPSAARVCVVGSSNLDLVATTDRLPSPGETVLGTSYREHPGGKGLNQAVAAARSGADTVFVSAVGDDSAGETLLDVMRSDSIDVTHVEVVHGLPTGRALIGVAASGENSIIVVPGANDRVGPRPLPDARVVLAQLEVPLETVIDTFRQARACGARTVLNPAPAADLPRELLELCDIVIPNEHELDLLGGVEELMRQGVGTVVVTRGASGADVHTDSTVEHIDSFHVEPLDTTGAGDTFCGSLCARLADGTALLEALRYAAAAAALSTTRSGAVSSIPTHVETERFIAGFRAPA